MKVALVHDWLVGMRGGERCLEIACRLFPQAQLYTLFRHEPGLSDTIAGMPWQTSMLQRFPGIRHYYRWMLPLMPTAVERLRIPHDVDLVLSFSHAVAHGVICPPTARHVCYCFTPMRYAWEMRQAYFGSHATSNDSPLIRRTATRVTGPVRNRLLDRARNWTRTASRRVTHFIAISRTIADRISTCFDRDSTIIFPPVDTQFYTPAPARREDFYLCVSALVPYKRIDLAIAACNRLGRRLIVIGTGPQEEQLRKMAGPSVEILGWQSGESIRDHYRRCRALLFPGLEDFGIVPLEAQACGAPVIAFGQGGASETIIADSAGQSPTGVFFGEQSAESLSAAIQRFEGQHPPFSSQAARANAERYRTERFQEELRVYLENVMHQGNSSSNSSPAQARTLVAA